MLIDVCKFRYVYLCHHAFLRYGLPDGLGKQQQTWNYSAATGTIQLALGDDNAMECIGLSPGGGDQVVQFNSFSKVIANVPAPTTKKLHLQKKKQKKRRSRTTYTTQNRPPLIHRYLPPTRPPPPSAPIFMLTHVLTNFVFGCTPTTTQR